MNGSYLKEVAFWAHERLHADLSTLALTGFLGAPKQETVQFTQKHTGRARAESTFSCSPAQCRLLSYLPHPSVFSHTEGIGQLRANAPTLREVSP